ncbi:MAG: hypothetical protein JST16_16430 [Bdellovibrionales bacterium]|nr:hypothetical protein [Bdellovibrionales bacterium]
MNSLLRPLLPLFLAGFTYASHAGPSSGQRIGERQNFSKINLRRYISEDEKGIHADISNVSFEVQGIYLSTFERRELLIESKRDFYYQSGSDGTGDKQRLRAFNALKPDKVLWTIEEDPGSSHAVWGSSFLMLTTFNGCCGSQNGHRAYSLETGKLLFPFSFANRYGVPITLHDGPLTPANVRFLGYHDNYWPSRDKRPPILTPAGLKLAGVLTYASALAPLQQIAFYYDEKAANDPSTDPDHITVSSRDHEWTFSPSDSGYEASGWKSREMGDFNPKKTFSRLSIEISFYRQQDIIRIPLEEDRLNVEQATVHGKFVREIAPVVPYR